MSVLYNRFIREHPLITKNDEGDKPKWDTHTISQK